MEQLTITENGLIMKKNKIILPEALIERAMTKAHQGSHPGISSMKRRLRAHFYFPRLSSRITEYVNNCEKCMMFTPKTTLTKMKAHELEEYQAWEKLSIDLFGPMPDGRSILVAQDMVTRFPAAKIITKTDADHVIDVLEEFYANYGTPEVNRTDNGPPFNSAQFKQFLETKGITQEKCFPYHPNTNPVETLMKSIGKTIKIAHEQGTDKRKALEEFLATYRATPHVSTELAPGDMMFRYGYTKDFPRKDIATESEIEQARLKDEETRKERTGQRNASRSDVKPRIGDKIMTRNHTKTSKFSPGFGPDMMEVIELEENGLIYSPFKLRSSIHKIKRT